MEIITSDRRALSKMLECFEYPAILINAKYEILAFNSLYQQAFGEVEKKNDRHRCYQASHGYQQPCDQSGEDCPLRTVMNSGRKERILHIHQTRNGAEHIEVHMLPIETAPGEPAFFVELMKPIPLASGTQASQSMVGSSPAFVRMLDRITKVAKTDAAVLLLGETGTGKELAAKAIHQSSVRKNQPLITLECSGLTDNLFESELFGYVKGAFTGANTTKKGLVELAHGGTLFLDEIADVPMTMQVKLLRLLENRTFRPLGSTEVKNSDFRLICATHKNIGQLIAAEQFRLDLYHRINVFPIQLPALRERLADLPEIVKALLRQLEPDAAFSLTDSALQFLQMQPMPGNIRELRNILNRAVVLAETNIIDKNLLQDCLDVGSVAMPHAAAAHAMLTYSPEEWVDLKTLEQAYLSEMRAAFPGDTENMAKILGISTRSLYRKLKEIRD